MSEEQCCDEAHCRAHKAYNHGGNAECYKYWAVLSRCHETERKLYRKLLKHEHFKYDCYRLHDRDFMEGYEKNTVAHTAHLNCDVVAYHGVYHHESHDCGENQIL